MLVSAAQATVGAAAVKVADCPTCCVVPGGRDEEAIPTLPTHGWSCRELLARAAAFFSLIQVQLLGELIFILQTAVTAKPRPSQRKEPAAPARSFLWVTGVQALVPSASAFPSSLVGSWIGSRAPRTCTGTHTASWHCRWRISLLYHRTG